MKLLALLFLTLTGTLWFGIVYFSSILPALGMVDGWQFLLGLLLYVCLVCKMSAVTIAILIAATWFLILEITGMVHR